jgi:hypothetical protein
MGYTENINSILKWGNAFQRQFGIPLDRSSLHGSYEDAVAYAKGDGSDERGLGKESYIGQIITVWGLNEKNKEGVWVYSLVPSTKEGYKADLKPVGAGTGTETADNYSAAKLLSNDLVAGQLIQVANEEDVEETIDGVVVTNKYKAGFYIVNAPGSISALDTSTGASDEIGAILTRVAALESNKVAKADFEAYQSQMATDLDAKVDNTALEAYQGTVSSALDAKVDNTALETYKGTVTTALDAKVDDSDFEAYQGTVTTALDGKVDNTALETYKGTVTTALDAKASVEALNNLDTKVEGDIKNLSDHLVEFSGTVIEIDGRLDSLEDFVDGHIAHDAIETSAIEGLFNMQAE